MDDIFAMGCSSDDLRSSGECSDGLRGRKLKLAALVSLWFGRLVVEVDGPKYWEKGEAIVKGVGGYMASSGFMPAMVVVVAGGFLFGLEFCINRR